MDTTTTDQETDTMHTDTDHSDTTTTYAAVVRIAGGRLVTPDHYLCADDARTELASAMLATADHYHDLGAMDLAIAVADGRAALLATPGDALRVAGWSATAGYHVWSIDRTEHATRSDAHRVADYCAEHDLYACWSAHAPTDKTGAPGAHTAPR